jgi:hypothetical protein
MPGRDKPRRLTGSRMEDTRSGYLKQLGLKGPAENSIGFPGADPRHPTHLFENWRFS